MLSCLPKKKEMVWRGVSFFFLGCSLFSNLMKARGCGSDGINITEGPEWIFQVFLSSL